VKIDTSSKTDSVQENNNDIQESDSGFSLKFVNHDVKPQAEINYNLDTPIEKPVIEVLNGKENSQKRNLAEEIVTGKASREEITKIRKAFEFKTQDNFTNHFFIFHLPGYDKEYAQTAYLEDQIIFKYENLASEQYFWVNLHKKYDKKQTALNFVTDYIVLNIKKSEEGFWEKDSWSLKEYDDNFSLLLKENDSRIEEIATTKEKNDKQTADSNQDQLELKEATEENRSTEISESVPVEESAEVGEAKLSSKKLFQINFISFDKCNFAFSLD